MKSLIILLAMSGVMASALAMTTQKPAGCRRLTAALGYGDHRIFFFGNDYIDYDGDFKKIESGNNTQDVFGAPYPDAAFRFNLDRTFYYFSDAYYFSWHSDYRPVEAKIFGGTNRASFFKDGLDAGGNYKGRTVFFKGCEMIMYVLWRGPSRAWPTPYGIPCNLDAALTLDNELLLFKDDKVWKLPPYDQIAEAPVETSSIVDFGDIRLCAEGEKEE